MNDSMQGLQGIGKFVPGFDFLQGLVKNAGATMPFSQWVAPTLDPKELERRIEELRTVQFWLETNARMLATTIQALEVQKMTLSTLQNMNVSADALREALKVRMPEPLSPQAHGMQAKAPPRSRPEPEPEPEPEVEAEEEEEAPKPARKGGQRKSAAAASGDGGVDPMQWWGALTRQFATLATETMTEAMKETATATEAARSMASSMAKPAADAVAEGVSKVIARKSTAKGERAATRTSAKAPARPSGRGGSRSS